MTNIEQLSSNYKQVKTYPILMSSKSLDKAINELADNGGGLIVIGYDSKSKQLISTKDFYCEKILNKVSITNKNIISSKRIIVNNIEIFAIEINQSEEYKNSFC